MEIYLSEADILLFDEPTASLDEELEATLLLKIQALFQDKTVLLLTHRSAPLALADQVAILSENQLRAGSVTEMASLSPQISDWLANCSADSQTQNGENEARL